LNRSKQNSLNSFGVEVKDPSVCVPFESFLLVQQIKN
jgi:hypothetical protein